jgi:hypothetical protein
MDAIKRWYRRFSTTEREEEATMPDDERDRRHLHIRDDDDVEPGDRDYEDRRDREGNVFQDDGEDLPPRRGRDD